MTRVLESSKIQSFCLTSMLFIPFIWFGLNILKPIVPSISTQSISLNQIIQIPAPKPIEKIEPIQKPKEIIKPKPTPKPIPAKPVPTKAKPAKTTPINSQPAPAQQTQQIESFNISSATNHPVLAAIKSAINKNHIYPRAAKRLKQQGEVLVEFIWTKDMELKGLKILKASKHKALNDAAIATITAAAKSFPKHDKTMQIQIPLVYKIN
ncbi:MULTISPECIES: energy transducer TonB [Campylobacter]|uniref:energy transducer TonB family protein n=1 Tax=Campylobacter TaxID=194 RepID=UPI000A300116|nr:MULTISPECIES: TonB family protein [unclassified Campylobacter]ARR03472.1 energy transduction protein TonB [Campylobacter sp. RM12175]MCR8690326.1 TonB family protein [Campylobacter sp. RM9264]MCR8701185.1 TonB family protein [Campylobacter sp. RM12176]